MRRFFDPESLLWKPLGLVGELVMLSLLWALCSVPLFTLGSASAALYDTAVHALRRRDDALFSRFFATFRRELKEGILSTLLWAAVLGLIALLYSFALRLLPAPAGRSTLALLPALLIAFFALGVFCWLCATLSRFTLSLGALQSVSLRLAFGHSLRSAAMALIWGVSLFFSLRYVSPFIFLPGAAALLCTYLIEPIFERYEQEQAQSDPGGP